MIDIRRLQALSRGFRDIRVLVVGDVMLDQYIWGTVSRISPEAPVPVIEVKSESQRLGGAANVAHNLRSLGTPPFLCSIIGKDDAGERVQADLRKIGVTTDHLLIDSVRPTTIKTRIIAHQQQVARLDRELREDISHDHTSWLFGRIQTLLPHIDGIILEDYGKGVVTGELVQQVVECTRKAGKIVAVDPKISHFTRYAGVSVMTPNHHEAGASVNIPIESHREMLLVGKELLQRLHCKYVLITRGEEGMSLFDRQAGMVTHVPTMAQEVFDVTGAGDTVIAVLTAGLASGANPVDAVLLANAAASVVVGKIGTATLNQEELQAALRTMKSLDVWQEECV